MSNRFAIREVWSRYKNQAAYFVDDATVETPHGPFWSEIRAKQFIKELAASERAGSAPPSEATISLPFEALSLSLITDTCTLALNAVVEAMS